jgi:hypothetical protein
VASADFREPAAGFFISCPLLFWLTAAGSAAAMLMNLSISLPQAF